MNYTADNFKTMHQLEFWIERIETQIEACHLNEAIKSAQECKQLFPDLGIPDYLLALAHKYAGNPAQALIQVDVCLAKHQSWSETASSAYLRAACLRARILNDLNRNHEATEVLVRIGRGHQFSQAFLLLAFGAIERSSYAQALEYCAEGIVIAPHNVPLWFAQAQTQKSLGDSAAAFASLSSVLAIDNKHLEALRLLAQMELDDDRTAAAVKTAARILRIDERDEVGLSVSFFAHLHMGQWNQAESVLPTLLAVNPADRDSYIKALELSRTAAGNAACVFNRDTLFNSGTLAYRQDDFEQALSLFQTARTIDLQASDPQLSLWTANCLSKLDRRCEAIGYYESVEAIECSPEDMISLYSGWGSALLIEDRPILATSLLEKAYQLNSTDISIQIALAVCYGATGRITDAIELSGKILELTPSFTDAGIVHITYLLHDDQLDRACKAAGNLMRIAPLDPKSHYLSGLVYHRLGEYLHAMNFAAYYLKANPGEQMAIDLYLNVSDSLDKDLGIIRRRVD